MTNRPFMKRVITLLSLVLYAAAASAVYAQRSTKPLILKPNRVKLSNGQTFALNLPAGYAISVAAQGLKAVRFMARSPDDRIFVTDMYNLTDNRKGAVYILDRFDAASKSFARVIPYLQNLPHPNTIAFYTDGSGTTWFFLPLTDRFLRYRYTAGETQPSGEPEVLATFPDY